MRHDGTMKVKEKVQEGLDGFGSMNVTLQVLEAANTTYEKVYQALGGKANGIDVKQVDSNTVQFVKGCAHTQVLEEYTRQGPNKYRVSQTCTRCGKPVSEFSRVGGEMSERKVVERESHLMKDEPKDLKNPGGAKGGDDEGWDEYDDPPDDLPPEEEESEGGGGKGEGAPSDGEGESDGEGDGEGGSGGEGEGDGEGEGEGEGDGEGEGEGDDTEGEGGEGGEGEGDGDDDAEGEGEGEGDGDSDSDSEEGEGEGEGGGDSDGDGDGECEEGEGGEGGEGEDGDSDAPPPSYREAFKRHWDGFLSEEHKAMIYRRISLMYGEEEMELPLAGTVATPGEDPRNTSLKVSKEPGKYGKTKVETG